MAGQSIAAASSQAHAVMGAQAETALNSGWILDQTIGAGPAFATAAAPSTQTAFLSSGDGTTGSGNSFYALGRRLKVVGSTGTSYCQVTAASFGAPVTTVTVGDFQTGGTTQLSTGGITSAAAAYMVPGLLGNTPNISLGSSYPSSGLVRVGYSTQAIVGRTSASVDDVIWPHQTFSTTLAADVSATGVAPANVTSVFNVPLAAGKWLVNFGTVAQNIVQANYAAAVFLFDGSRLISAFASALSTGISAADSTGTGRPMSFSYVVTNTSALTYSILLEATSTSVKLLANTPSTGAITAMLATYVTAVKIG